MELTNATAPRQPFAEQTDEQLVQRVCAGEVAAFEGIMRRYNQRLFRIARSIIKSDVDAMDVMQEAYVSAYTRLESLKDSRVLAVWLGRIVRNHALLKLRHKQRSVLMDEEMLQTVVDMSSYTPSMQMPEEIAARQQLSHLLEKFVDALPDDFRSTFMLRAIEGSSVRETADILGIPEATVKTRFFRAKKLLCKQLSEQLIERGIAIHEFAGHRCDAVVNKVMKRIATPGREG